jgi:hypothetical protein
MAFPTFEDLQGRYLDLIGDSDGTIDDFGKENINRAIEDVLNKYPFSWNVKTADLTLVAGVADMPTDYNPRWELTDAREGDNVFTNVPIYNKESYGSDDYIYWITSDVSGDKYIFNSKTLTGTVTIYYNFIPTELSATTDKCPVPDKEAVSYLAASKNWVGAERDEELQKNYMDMADRYITALYFRDLQQSPTVYIGSLAGDNLGL